MHQQTLPSERGFSLIEAIVAIGLMSIGVLSLAAVFTSAVAQTTSASADVIARDKAFEALESIIAARDSKRLSWDDLNNTDAGGLFLVDFQPIRRAGADGIIGTSDDLVAAAETLPSPGRDQELGTADDGANALTMFSRRIVIANNGSNSLRRITVTIRHKTAGQQREFTVETLITSFGVGQ
jgi:type II secretory pathway pseudopilin PulG